MGLMISDLLSASPALSSGACGQVRPNENLAGAEGGTEEFAARLAGLLQQLKQNTSHADASPEGQELAAQAESTAQPGDTASMPGDTASMPGADVTARNATASPAEIKPLLGALILGPTLNVIQPVQRTPDVQSLMAFARSQGLDDRAIQWLLGPAMTESTEVTAATSVSRSGTAWTTALPTDVSRSGTAWTTALPTDASAVASTLESTAALPSTESVESLASVSAGLELPADLQALASQLMDLLRQWIALHDPQRPVEDATLCLLPIDLSQGLGINQGMSQGQGLGLGQSPGLAVQSVGDGIPQGLSPDQSVDQGKTLDPGLVSSQAEGSDEAPGETLIAVMRAALDTAALMAKSGKQGDTAMAKARTAASAMARAPSQVQEELQHQVRQSLKTLLAALSGASVKTMADDASASPASRGVAQARLQAEALGHQATVFVRAALRLQHAQGQSAASADASGNVVSRPKPTLPSRIVEIDLSDAWVGDDPALLSGDRARAQRQALARHELAVPPSTVRALASRSLVQETPLAPVPSSLAPTHGATSPDATHPAALGVSADRSMPPQINSSQPLEELTRQRPTTQSVSASAAGGDTGGYKSQDPHRGHLLAERMGEAVAQRLLQAVDRGEWSVKLALKPASLGHIEVQMRMHSGGLDAQFQASQTVTRDLLADGLQRLRESLVQMGMDVAQLNVGGGRSQQRGGDSTPRQTATGKAAGVQAKEETDATNQAIPSGPRRASGWDMLV